MWQRDLDRALDKAFHDAAVYSLDHASARIEGAYGREVVEPSVEYLIVFIQRRDRIEDIALTLDVLNHCMQTCSRKNGYHTKLKTRVFTFGAGSVEQINRPFIRAIDPTDSKYLDDMRLRPDEICTDAVITDLPKDSRPIGKALHVFVVSKSGFSIDNAKLQGFRNSVRNHSITVFVDSPEVEVHQGCQTLNQ